MAHAAPPHVIESPATDGCGDDIDRKEAVDAAAVHKRVGTRAPAAAGAGLSALALTGCGGGSNEPTPAADPPIGSAPTPAAAPNRVQAARFLAQAALAADSTAVARVRALGYRGWLDEQMALPPPPSRVQWLRSQGYDATTYKSGASGADNMLWSRLMTGDDMLRLRVSLALSEIVVVGIAGIAGTSFVSFASAAFVDILEANAFGSYRTLLEQVSTSVAMGCFLTFRGNRKASGTSLPDENYARELMQLFTIGLVQLERDGSARLGADGRPLETYTLADVSQLARVFTGWDFDASAGTSDAPDRALRPMVQQASRHELGEKRFLGTVIPAGTDGVRSLQLALDALVAHPNTGPFIGRQLIQRLVTSDPSAAYVSRVAAAFDDNGAGVKGDLSAVVRAVLLDSEARSESNLANPDFGKLREPVLRFVQWGRSFRLADGADKWSIGDTSNPATRLGQSPLRSPSVFNFFRPGYVPPGVDRAAPEFQITTETSVAGYLNYLQAAIANGVAGLKADYAAMLPLVADSRGLLDELNQLLAAGQVSATTLAALKTALDTMPVTTPVQINNRLYAAVLLVMASPEYLTQK